MSGNPQSAQTATRVGPESDTLQARKPSARRLWWRIHQWAGLQLSLLLAFACLTGTIATLGHEIDWLITPSLRVAPADVSAGTQWTQLASQAVDFAPDARIVEIIAPEATAFAARIVIERPDGSRAYLNSHPSTGAVQGESPWYGAHRLFSKLHERMNIEAHAIKIVISSLSLILLASTISAMVVYRKWWRGFLKPVRLRDSRTAWRDFHRLAGVWSLAFVLIIGGSGMLFFFDNIGLGGTRPGPVETPAVISDDDVLAAMLPRALASAAVAAPTLEITKIRFPDKKSGTYIFEGTANDMLVRIRANSIWVDPATARVLRHDTPATLDNWSRIHEAAQPLHFGSFGGYWLRYVWFIFGALLTSLPISGAIIYGLRIARSSNDFRPIRLTIASAWLGMGYLRWPIASLILAGLLASFVII